MADRGIFGGGSGSGSNFNTIQYVTISNAGNTTDFGDLSAGRYYLTAFSNGSNDRCVFAGGAEPSNVNTIEYITISSTGNASDFGDLTRSCSVSSTSNATNERGVISLTYDGGDEHVAAYSKDMDYVTINTTANASDYADLAKKCRNRGALSNGTNERGVFTGGEDYYIGTANYEYENQMDRITINTTSNGVDFGDLSSGYDLPNGGASNSVNERGTFFSFGHIWEYEVINRIEYITINSPSNSTLFGGLTQRRTAAAGLSNGIGDRALCGGGKDVDNDIVYDIIDYHTLSNLGDAQDFGDLAEVTWYLSGTSNYTSVKPNATKWQAGVDIEHMRYMMTIDRDTTGVTIYSIEADGLFIPETYTPIPSNRGIFIAGSSNSEGYNVTIQYITIASLGNSQDFGDLLTGRNSIEADSNGSNDRAFMGGGRIGSPNTDQIEYCTISATGNSSDFGDLIEAKRMHAACSNRENERGISSAGGFTSDEVNNIDYITINSTGNASDFGDLTQVIRNLSGTSNATNERGTFNAGRNNASYYNYIQYVTINSGGNATDAADLTVSAQSRSATSNATNERSVVSGGRYGATYYDIIDYYTINSISNATDFGDLLDSILSSAAVSNGTDERAIWSGGSDATTTVDTIQYITINTTGNASDFGDLFLEVAGHGGASN